MDDLLGDIDGVAGLIFVLFLLTVIGNVYAWMHWTTVTAGWTTGISVLVWVVGVAVAIRD